MKKILLSTAFVMTATAAMADGLTALGLDDPEVMAPPASFNWNGPYAGLSYGRTNAGSTITTSEGVYDESCVKSVDGETAYLDGEGNTFPRECGDNSDGWTYIVDERILVDTIETTVSTESASDNFGAFVGYRWDLDPVVLGVEGGFNGDLNTLEAQAGLGFGRVLVYGFGGVADLDGTDGTVYGFGTDFAITDRVIVGVKHTISDDLGFDSTLARVAIKF